MSTARDLVGTYTFTAINGEPVKNEELLRGLPVTLELAAGNTENDLKFFASVGNSYRGQISHDAATNTYKGMLMSTRMAVPSDYMPIVRVIDSFMDGATMKKEGTVLTVTSDKGTATFNAK